MSVYDRSLTGSEGKRATVVGGWTILGVNSFASWVSLRHDSGATITLPWHAVVVASEGEAPEEDS